MQNNKIYIINIDNLQRWEYVVSINSILETISYLREFNIASTILRLILAVLLSGLIGIERSKSGRAAGLRTHILVCLGAAIASMTGLYINAMYNTGDVSRIAAQVVSGISFLGAGTILVRNKATVTGLTTAACIWAVGTIGIAIGYGFYEVALIGTCLILFINNILNRVDKKIRHNMKDMSIYVEFVNVKQLNATLDAFEKLGLEIDIVDLVETKTKLTDGIGAEIIVQIHKQQNEHDLVEKINNVSNVHFAIITNH
jgi:putative Mg2+ transporter-C (MgtC) family protein